MKNFNIRFECLDARDDYWAQLKKKASILSTWEEADLTFLEDCTSDNLYAHHSENDEDDIPLHLLHIGKRELKWQREAMTMQNILTNLGWTSENQVNTHTNIELNPPPIQRILSGLEWKN